MDLRHSVSYFALSNSSRHLIAIMCSPLSVVGGWSLKKNEEINESYSPFAEFLLMSDEIEEWIEIKESQFKRAGDGLNCDKKLLQHLQKKQIEFSNGLNDYKTHAIDPMLEVKSKFISSDPLETAVVATRCDRILRRFALLLRASSDRCAEFTERIDRFKTDKIFVKFAKNAMAVYMWIELVKSDTAKIGNWLFNKRRAELFSRVETSMRKISATLKKLEQLDAQIEACGMGTNPYTSLTTASLRESWVVILRAFYHRKREVTSTADCNK